MLHYRKTKQTYNNHRKGDKAKPTCGFCEAETKERHVMETETTMVIPNRVSYDIFEGRRVVDHLMVIPKAHRESIAEFTDTEQLEMMKVIGEYESKGYNVYARGVGSISRSMQHQHTHLIKLSQRSSKLILFLKRPYVLLDV